MSSASARMLQTFGRVSKTIQEVDSQLRLYRHKVQHFTPKLRIQSERGPFLIKTAENGDDLEACLRLRYEVFHREFLSKKRQTGVDIDKLDFQCDHLMILDRRAGSQVIGTYRLNSSRFTDRFYSSAEFHLDPVLAEPGHKLELGRACIDKAHRNGVVISLLWRAIGEYLVRTESKLLFGCASIKTMAHSEIALIYKYLKDQGHLSADYPIVPTRKYRIPDLLQTVEAIESSGVQFNAQFNTQSIADIVPALFQSYTKMGAKACGEPALDKDFHCIDFLTVLKVEQLKPLFMRKYSV
jgi:putative hemolysin